MKPDTLILPSGDEIVLIHYLDAYGTRGIPCMPGLTTFSSCPERHIPHIRSEEPRAVNCPMCMKSNAYQRAMGVAIKHEPVVPYIPPTPFVPPMKKKPEVAPPKSAPVIVPQKSPMEEILSTPFDGVTK